MLVIAGSRSLEGVRGARERVVAIIRHMIEHRGARIIVHGRANAGPDRWAKDLLRAMYSMVEERPFPVRRGEYPLARNARMADAVRRMVLEQGALVVAVGFVDPASPTRGTEHMLRMCRERSICAVKCVWGHGATVRLVHGQPGINEGESDACDSFG